MTVLLTVLKDIFYIINNIIELYFIYFILYFFKIFIFLKMKSVSYIKFKVFPTFITKLYYYKVKNLLI